MLGNGTDSERLPFVLKKLEQVEAAYIKLESQLASGNRYPHMCRMDHEEIGHRDSSEDRCPMCRMRDGYEAQLAQYRWRRVEEEMPEEWTDVLVWGGKRVDVALRVIRPDMERWLLSDSGEYINNITHWMPMPPAPAEGE